ncbi:3-hydroxyacyl-CoA dehydrogenase family protein [Enterococcus cecorum]|uniref:3-hydroxyacyl-CoA dehydrogenase family protein n=1 Tax=Enterococcus cecorum TaxID=44008 RepID=UPI000A67F76B|nr:3-hydroxyacyl-CoA dehydrogenase family protein [Enterococcus cecorum]CAI3433894.1 3-hydroxyacyl-CoA dehydrogenase family protein [Enterococcus cecorum]
MKNFKVNTVTVVGANGTMGKNVSAIFSSFGNAKVYMISRDLKKSEQARESAYQSVRAESVKSKMIPADYSMLEKCIIESDIVFESVSENLEIKSEINKKIAEIAVKNIENCRSTIFCTGTSGLSVTDLAKTFPKDLQGNYMGMHMFNPPYTMTLCEMISTVYTNRELFNNVLVYCRDILHRTVVEVKDSPAFLGNRIGFQFINRALQYAEKYKYNGGIDYIDSILGGFTGRTMAPLVTSNFVGLDVHKAIVNNLYDNTDDFAHKTFILPNFAEKLIADGKLGSKSNGGLYKRIVHDSGVKIQQVYDIESGSYRNVVKYTFPFVETMIANLKEGNYNQAFNILKTNHSQEAEICMSFLLKYVLYSLKATELVGYDIHSADDVMATGFSWCPPLAMIEALGGPAEFRKLCRERIQQAELDSINLTELLQRIEPSKYDFRKFIKAKI